jgi:hypothetical protein
MQPLLWTTRSLRNLVAALAEQGHTVCPTVVGNLLHDMGYSLQANSKTREGGQHIDRDAQFQYINAQAKAFLAAHQPAISVDTKKKELVGNFKNNGREWHRQGKPELVNIHDFIDPKLSRAVPYGVYEITNNVGWVSVGTDHDTASFAVHAIHRWWRTMGKQRHPKATRLMNSADGGAGNVYRVRLWKVELQKLANELNLPITVCHLPPGTSKWNKIEHRLFSFITMNWRGKPLRSYRTIVQLIAATTTDAGLKVRAELDENNIPRRSRCPTLKWPPSTFRVTLSTVTGTIRSLQSGKSRRPNQLYDYGQPLSVGGLWRTCDDPERKMVKIGVGGLRQRCGST